MKLSVEFPSVSYREGPAAVAEMARAIERIGYDHIDIFDHVIMGVPIEGPHRDDRFWIEMLDDPAKRYGLDGESFEPDRWLVDGDQVTVGDLTLDVVHCPGHTPGHVVFVHAPSRLALVGDVLFAGSIGRTDFPKGNHQDLLDSITGKLWPLGDDVTFVPGHGPASTFGQERRTNPFVADARFG